jgi:hypothetical protein
MPSPRNSKQQYIFRLGRKGFYAAFHIYLLVLEQANSKPINVGE